MYGVLPGRLGRYLRYEYLRFRASSARLQPGINMR